MKVLDLQCAHQHTFEGWFASDREFSDQLERGLLFCPLCNDGSIRKMLSAPRLNLQSHREPQAEGAASGERVGPGEAQAPGASGSEAPPSLQAQWLRAARQLMAQTEDVGERFAEEARAMHQGEIEHRGIRGKASAEEAVALLEEGIEVLPLPAMPWLKGTLQ